MFKTIFGRLFWTTAAVVFFTVVVISLSMMGLLNKYVEDERFDSSMVASEGIEYLTVAMSRDGFDSGNMQYYESTLESWSMIVKADITVVNTAGRIFASTDRNFLVPEKYASKVLLGETVTGNSVVNGKNAKLNYVIGVPMKRSEQVIGGIFYFFPAVPGGSTVEKFSKTLFLTLIVAMLLSLVLIYFEARHISKPLKELNTAALEIASGKFDKRVQVTSRDEVAQLSSSFNHMADSLTHLEEMRQSFVSDISHELRTPMTSISGFV